MDLWLRICERFPVDFVPEALARVAKGGKAGRITANSAAIMSGREIFRQKYRQKTVEENVLHLYLRDIKPRRPQQNGKVERSYRIDSEEFWDRHAFTSRVDAEPKLRD